MPTILQLTDLHLLSDPAEELRGARTREIVQRVFNYVRQECETGRLRFDHLVITGDLAHDEQRETYVVLRELLGDWLPRCNLIPGNHDNRQFMGEVFPELWSDDDEYRTFSIEVGGWRLIGLDSHVPGEVPGRVAEAQLAWVRQQFAEHSDQPTVVFVHHPPFFVESAWLDRIGITNVDAVVDVLRSTSHLKAIVAGHVHHQFESEVNGVRLMTTPSSSLQFTPGAETLELDAAPPGFRVLHLEKDSVRTEVLRVED